MNDPRFFIRQAPWGRGFEIHFAERMDDGRHAVGLPVVVEIKDATSVMDPSPMLSVERPALQSLMDELWTAGIRPADIGTAGHLASTQAHLADFRALVSKAFDVKL